jgi:hypothetical protein
VLYNLALARLRAGDRAEALEALRLARAKGYLRAQRLLDELALAPPAGGAPQ